MSGRHVLDLGLEEHVLGLKTTSAYYTRVRVAERSFICFPGCPWLGQGDQEPILRLTSYKASTKKCRTSLIALCILKKIFFFLLWKKCSSPYSAIVIVNLEVVGLAPGCPWTGWPDWSNFRLLGDSLLSAVIF
jgi:hypothetical protein